MRRKAYTHTFLRGLETTGLEDGLELPAWVVFQNVRLADGAASIRPGMQLVGTATNANRSLQFVSGSTVDYVKAPNSTEIQTLAKRWTFEMMWKPTSVTGTRPLFGWNDAAQWPFKVFQDGTALKVTFNFNGGTPTTGTVTGLTLANGTTYVLQIVRASTGLITIYAGPLNGTLVSKTGVADSEAAYDMYQPSGAMLIGYDSAANEFDGVIDYVRCFSKAFTTRKWLPIRWPDPRCDYCLWDYVMEKDFVKTGEGTVIRDRSRHENHGETVGAPAVVTALAVQTMPVGMIHERLDMVGAHRLDVVAGTSIFFGEVND